MGGFKGFAGGVAMLALVAGGALGLAGTAEAKKSEEAAKPTNSPEFIKFAQTMQKAVQDLEALKGKASDADYKAAALKLVPQLTNIDGSIKTPLDRVIAGQWQQVVGGAAGDNALQLVGLKNMVASGQLPADKVGIVQFYIGAMSYQANDYAGAVTALQASLDANFTNDNVGELLVDAYAKLNKPADGLPLLKDAITKRKAAGTAIPASWYKRGQVVAYQAKLGPQSIEWSILTAASDPSPLNWLGAGQIVRQFAPKFEKEESYDLGRLFIRSNALTLEPNYTKSEYFEYIQAADARRSPAEVLKAIEAGEATGALDAKDPAIIDNTNIAKGRIAKGDQASLAGVAADAQGKPDGKVAQAAADGYLSYGEAAKAETLYRLALSKGGVDADRVNTRLGIALFDQGKYADAQAAFGAVSATGNRGGLAQLWSAFAGSKADAK